MKVKITLLHVDEEGKVGSHHFTEMLKGENFEKAIAELHGDFMANGYTVFHNQEKTAWSHIPAHQIKRIDGTLAK